MIKWKTPDGQPVSCTEKIKVLNENLEEFREFVTDALEDAALMGCDVDQVRAALRDLIDSVEVRYKA